MARRQLELSNEVAAELAGSQDAILHARGAPRVRLFLRGNVVTLDGEADAVQMAATVVRELSRWSTRGHDIGPATIEAVARVLDEPESPAKVLDDVVWRHRNLQGHAEVGEPEELRRRDPPQNVTFGVGPAGTGKTFLAMAMATAALVAPRGQPDHPHAPRGRGRRAAGFLPGDLMAKVDPVPAAAVRRPARHDGRRARRAAPRARRDRGRAAGVHARQHAQ